MANSIYNYVQLKNMTNITPEYCLKLAWGTNSGYDHFQHYLWNNSKKNNIYFYEQEAATEAKGNPCN